MKKIFAIYDPLQYGRVMQVCDALDQESMAGWLVSKGWQALEIAAHPVRGEAWVENGALHLVPPAPSACCEWDWPTKSWIESLELAKSAKRQAIERERDSRVVAQVIVYDGKNLDADAASIDRLSKKLAALAAYEARGAEIPAGLCFWRDADNVTHTFASHTEYKNWLSGLAIAIDARGSQAFAWSWQKKGEVDAATTIEAVAAIDAGPTG